MLTELTLAHTGGGGDGCHPQTVFPGCVIQLFTIDVWLFAWTSFNVFFTQGLWKASLYHLWFLSYDLVIKVMSRPNNENVPCYGFCHLSFDVDDISNYPWRFKWTSAMNRVKRLAGDPRTGHITPSHMTSSYVTKKYVNNSSQNRVRDVGDVSLCSSCQAASTDLQHNYLNQSFGHVIFQT